MFQNRQLELQSFSFSFSPQLPFPNLLLIISQGGSDRVVRRRMQRQGWMVSFCLHRKTWKSTCKQDNGRKLNSLIQIIYVQKLYMSCLYYSSILCTSGYSMLLNAVPSGVVVYVWWDCALLTWPSFSFSHLSIYCVYENKANKQLLMLCTFSPRSNFCWIIKCPGYSFPLNLSCYFLKQML